MVAPSVKVPRETAGAMRPASANASSHEADESKERGPQISGTAGPADGSPFHQQDAARRECAESANASSSSSAASLASAYVLLGECRRLVRSGVTLQQFWEALPPLANPEQCLCTPGPGLEPTCGKIRGGGNRLSASMSARGRGVEMERRRANERLAQLVLLQGAQGGDGSPPEDRCCSQGEKEQPHSQDEAQIQGRKQGLLLPLLVARAEVKVGSPGRAEVLFRAEDTLSPGLTYCAYAPKHRSLAKAQQQGKTKSQASAGTEMPLSTTDESDGARQAGEQCTLRLPNGSSRPLPGGLSLQRAVEILRESEREAQGRPSTAPTDRSSSGNDTASPRRDTLGIFFESSAGATSPTAPGPNGQGGVPPQAPLPLLLLARTEAGCHVLLQPGDTLQPGAEYLVRLRPTQGKHKEAPQLHGTGVGSKRPVGSDTGPGRGPGTGARVGAGLTDAQGARTSEAGAGRREGASLWAMEAAMNRPPTQPAAPAATAKPAPSTGAAQASGYFFRSPAQPRGGQGPAGAGPGGFGAGALQRPATADPRQGRSRGLGRSVQGVAGEQAQAPGSSMLDGAIKTWSSFFGQK